MKSVARYYWRQPVSYAVLEFAKVNGIPLKIITFQPLDEATAATFPDCEDESLCDETEQESCPR